MNVEDISSRLDDILLSDRTPDIEQLLNLHHDVLTCSARLITDVDMPDNRYRHIEHFLRHAILLQSLGQSTEWKQQLEAARVVAMNISLSRS